jgi:hypothetical protein
MIALVAIAIPLALYEFSSVFGTSAAAPPPPAQGRTSSSAPKKSGVLQASSGTLDPTLHLGTLEASRHVKYEAGGRNIFRMEALPLPTPIAPIKTSPTPFVPPTPPPTPPPPPIPLKFYGFASKSNEPKRIFLEESGSVFIAKQGDIVDRRYKVVQILNTSVLIEDVLTNHRQSIPLTAK